MAITAQLLCNQAPYSGNFLLGGNRGLSTKETYDFNCLEQTSLISGQRIPHGQR